MDSTRSVKRTYSRRNMSMAVVPTDSPERDDSQKRHKRLGPSPATNPPKEIVPPSAAGRRFKGPISFVDADDDDDQDDSVTPDTDAKTTTSIERDARKNIPKAKEVKDAGIMVPESQTSFDQDMTEGASVPGIASEPRVTNGNRDSGKSQAHESRVSDRPKLLKFSLACQASLQKQYLAQSSPPPRHNVRRRRLSDTSMAAQMFVDSCCPVAFEDTDTL
ncbi:hypothetical protein BU24DRAFT_35747 [Aaosphaeria arxii CBS 175.79]|uniref:Uncharacterized protein n=1 Tax=Aaosphaeria arxii CBS 175.79 TaxID=1450172 RepID=A0A6A5YB80_9PLEO|nr:uncharacterized protein BU24DRAFT_35747 [Aaosphaeria arxii CBS 175.79]KAF2022020.1 hypothetical protein BU24DRAFT_35747 [Aaosphaeria arxii CBS 175.79]